MNLSNFQSVRLGLESISEALAHDYESQAKATEGKAGMAGSVDAPVRCSTAGTGLRVGEASADLPATSEHGRDGVERHAPNSQTNDVARFDAVPGAPQTIAPASSGASSNSDGLDIPAFLDRRERSAA